MSGQRFEHYVLDSVLGSGTFGTVYRGRDIRDGSAVAVKVLDKTDPAAVLPQLRAEAAAMRSVDDPHCVRVLAVVETDPPAIVTEFVNGATLRAVLARAGSLTGPQAVDVVRGALLGVAAVHAAGLRHGDVKPDNILVDRGGVSRLIDFGLAQTVTGTAAAALSGSPAYMSPEQVRGGMVDARSDIYAFAAVLFELLTGRRPFPGDTTAEVLRAHLEQPVPDARAVSPAVSEQLATVCRTGLAKDPADRYQSAAEFLAALEAAAERSYGAAWAAGAGLGALAGAVLDLAVDPGRSTEPHSSGPQRRAPGRSRRTAVLRAGAGIGVLVVAVVLVLSVVHHPRRNPSAQGTPAAPASSTGAGARGVDVVGSSTARFVSPAPIGSNSYYAVSCPTDQVCLATGQSASGRPLLSVTVDAGATWSTTYPTTGGTLGLLSCADPKTCVAGYYDTAIHMERTTDGGASWSSAATPHVTNLQSISCPTATQCLAVGGANRNGSGGPQAIATSDGGRSWRSVAVPGPANSVSCPDATHCWVSGAGDKVWAGTVTATSWAAVSPPSTFPPSTAGSGPFPANSVFPLHGRIGELGFYVGGVAFSSDQYGIAFGGALCGGYRVTKCASGVYRTGDGARTWSFWPQADEDRYGNGAYAACVGSGCLLVTDTFSKSVLISTADGRSWVQRHDFGQFAGRVTCSGDGAVCIVIGHSGLWVSQG